VRQSALVCVRLRVVACALVHGVFLSERPARYADALRGAQLACHMAEQAERDHADREASEANGVRSLALAHPLPDRRSTTSHPSAPRVSADRAGFAWPDCACGPVNHV
jgi:hypothetical protein